MFIQKHNTRKKSIQIPSKHKLTRQKDNGAIKKRIVKDSREIEIRNPVI